MSRGPSDGAGRGYYFFVSYAHVPPNERRAVPDPVVRKFFDDLSAQVRRFASEDSPLGIGLYDQSQEVGPDWNARLSFALGSAEVLVPLYSPRYVANGSWSMGECVSFQERLRTAQNPSGHIQPVLWMPLPPGVEAPSDDLPSIGEGVVPYTEFGLGGMCELNLYREAYQAIVSKLAERIVRVAEGSPIGPSAAPDPAERSAPDPAKADLVIAVLAPTTDDVPPERSPDAYGPRARDWMPFPQVRPLTLAQHAVDIARRIEIDAAIVDLVDTGFSFTRPTIVLIDPWLLASRTGERRLRHVLLQLPDWVKPMVVSDENDPQFPSLGRELHRRAIDMVGPPATSQRSPIGGIDRADRFISMMPVVASQARNRFRQAILPRLYPPRPRMTDRSSRTSSSPGTGDT